MTTYGKSLQQSVPLIINMNALLVLCLAASISVCSGVEAQREYYPEVTPEDVMVELGRLIQQHRQQQRAQEISYHFPEYPAEAAPFAVRPSDPRYYQDTRQYQAEPDPVQPDQVLSDLIARDLASSDPAQQSEEEESGEVEDEQFKTPTPSPAPPVPDDKSHASLVQGVDQKPINADPVDNSDLYFIAIVAGCCAAAVVGIIAIGISWHRLQKNAKAAADVEYPAYGVTGPNKEVSPTGDRRLAQSAQMYHYQHQKQQIIAMESQLPAERNGSLSEAESDEENEEGDYTVYECPGLAPTGEMEVKNPLFQDDPTPATPAPTSKEQPSNQERASKP